jgi:hypothetical protein
MEPSLGPPRRGHRKAASDTFAWAASALLTELPPGATSLGQGFLVAQPGSQPPAGFSPYAHGHSAAGASTQEGPGGLPGLQVGRKEPGSKHGYAEGTWPAAAAQCSLAAAMPRRAACRLSRLPPGRRRCGPLRRRRSWLAAAPRGGSWAPRSRTSCSSFCRRGRAAVGAARGGAAVGSRAGRQGGGRSPGGLRGAVRAAPCACVFVWPQGVDDGDLDLEDVAEPEPHDPALRAFAHAGPGPGSLSAGLPPALMSPPQPGSQALGGPGASRAASGGGGGGSLGGEAGAGPGSASGARRAGSSRGGGGGSGGGGRSRSRHARQPSDSTALQLLAAEAGGEGVSGVRPRYLPQPPLLLAFAVAASSLLPRLSGALPALAIRSRWRPLRARPGATRWTPRSWTRAERAASSPTASPRTAHASRSWRPYTAWRSRWACGGVNGALGLASSPTRRPTRRPCPTVRVPRAQAQAARAAADAAGAEAQAAALRRRELLVAAAAAQRRLEAARGALAALAGMGPGPGRALQPRDAAMAEAGAQGGGFCGPHGPGLALPRMGEGAGEAGGGPGGGALGGRLAGAGQPAC